MPEDVFVPRAIVQQFHLRSGQHLAGTLRLPRDREKGLVLDQVTTIEGAPAEQWTEPPDFEKLTPQFPQGRIMLENPKTNSISARAVDLLTPLGPRAARFDRGAAAGGQNDFAQGNRESDSGELSGHRSDVAAGR